MAGLKFLFTTLALVCFMQGLAQPRLVPYRKGEKWGYADRSGKIVINPKYDAAELFVNNLAAVKSNGYWGVITPGGRSFLPVEYDEIFFLNDTLLLIQQYGRRGLISATGRKILDIKYGNIYLDQDVKGMLRVTDVRGFVGFADINGHFLLEPSQFRWINGFQGNYMAEARPGSLRDDEGKKGMVDTTGRVLVPPDHYDVEHLHNGFFKAATALAEQNNSLDRQENYEGYVLLHYAKRLTQDVYSDIWYAGEGTFIVEVKTGYYGERRYGLIDSTGKVILPVEYRSISNYSLGLAAVCEAPPTDDYYFGEDGELELPKDPEGYYIDPHGKVILKGDYLDVEPFLQNGFALVALKEENKEKDEGGREYEATSFRLIDREGRMYFKTFDPFEARYLDYTPGKAAELPWVVKKGKKYFYAFLDGKLLTKDSFDYANVFVDGTAVVGKNHNNNNTLYGLLDKNGRHMTDLKYDGFAYLYKTGSRLLAKVSISREQNGRYIRYNGILNKSGGETVPVLYGDITPFHSESLFASGFAKVSGATYGYSRFHGIIDSTGNLVLPIAYTGVHEMNLADSFVSISQHIDTVNGKITVRFGLFKPWTKQLIPPQFEEYFASFGSKKNNCCKKIRKVRSDQQDGTGSSSIFL